jgi:hypothetical protein
MAAWFKRFPSPIALADGRRLHTLQDALDYIVALPKAESETADWRLAMEALTLATEHVGYERLAQAAVLHALQSPRAPEPPKPPRLRVVRKAHQP